jgi:metal-responsive CopG/Arc/MetJ family transcriptional regulator
MKVAISVPDPVFEAADRLAKQRDVPRSQLFSEALQEYLLRHGSTAITTRLNEVYAVQDSVLDQHLAYAQFAATDDEAW